MTTESHEVDLPVRQNDLGRQDAARERQRFPCTHKEQHENNAGREERKEISVDHRRSGKWACQVARVSSIF